MLIFKKINPLRERLRQERQVGFTVAFVPTMGNLHEGHLALVKRALKEADRVVVSIYVNPMQFGENEDFSTYPRTLKEDQEKLEALGVHHLFIPTDKMIYPEGKENCAFVKVPHISEGFCAVTRPAFFTGIATVVTKLFNIVQPDVAVFGEKDFQQLLMVKKMVEDLNFPIRIIGSPTVREKDGLAMSSRNNYLSKEERKYAPFLRQTLLWMKQKIEKGETDLAKLEKKAAHKLKESGFSVDYLSIRDVRQLQKPKSNEKELVILTASCLGKTRLIDNCRVQI